MTPRDARRNAPATLWSSDDVVSWQAALASHADAIERQGVARLPDLDRWYRDELPASISTRVPAHVTHAELVRVAEWKMARGIFRARNLALVRGNDAASVEATSTAALAEVPDPSAPIRILSELAGVGPATASAIAAAAAPEVYPFFDELVAAQIPDLGTLTFTPAYYARYATALRDRAARLGEGWTPVLVERALWSHVGGKAGVALR